MSDNPGGMMGGSGLKIGGMNFPKWGIYVGAGGLVIALLFLKNRNQAAQTDTGNVASGNASQAPGVTDTGTGMLAAEFDQRLREQWEAWQKWANETLSQGDGILQPPGTTLIGPPVSSENPCQPGDIWDGVRCNSPVRTQANYQPCGSGEIWDGMGCQSTVQREETLNINEYFCPPNMTRDNNGNCVSVVVNTPPAILPSLSVRVLPVGAECEKGSILTPYGCSKG